MLLLEPPLVSPRCIELTCADPLAAPPIKGNWDVFSFSVEPRDPIKPTV